VLFGAAYLYVNLGDQTLTLTPTMPSGSFTTAKFTDATYNIFRAKLEYKF
jgi:hypothetical protein